MEDLTAGDLWKKIRETVDRYDINYIAGRFADKCIKNIDKLVSNTIETIRANLFVNGKLNSALQEEIDSYLGNFYNNIRIVNLLSEYGWKNSKEYKEVLGIISKSSREEAIELVKEKYKSKNIDLIHGYFDIKTKNEDETEKKLNQELEAITQQSAKFGNGRAYLNKGKGYSGWYFVFESPINKLSDLPERCNDWVGGRIGIAKKNEEKLIESEDYSLNIEDKLSNFDLLKLGVYMDYITPFLSMLRKEIGGRILDASVSKKQINNFDISKNNTGIRIDNDFTSFLRFDGVLEEMIVYKIDSKYIMKNSFKLDERNYTSIEEIIKEE